MSIHSYRRRPISIANEYKETKTKSTSYTKRELLGMNTYKEHLQCNEK